MRSFALVLAWTFVASAANPPEVQKVEPPNWWAHHSINPVRLLIRGRNLGNARVAAVRPGISVNLESVNPAGTYLFADVRIDDAAAPGDYPIRISTSEGTADAGFTVSPPLPSQGRFQGFSPDDVIYLVMPDRFANGDPANDDPPASRGLFNRIKPRYYHGGDLQGITDHLTYIRDLGATAIWINPIYDNVNHLNDRERYDNQAITDYHGYGAVDFYSVEEHFGNLDKFRELVDAAHRLGLKVIQDQVANHTGPYHPWVQDPPTPTWFNGTAASHIANTWQTWALTDPHATPQAIRSTLNGWFLNILPDLNQSDPQTARYLIQNTLWWIGVSGIDGIRQDTLPYVPRDFWRDWSAAIKREYPRFRVVGEVFESQPAVVSFFQGGAARFDGVDDGIDTLFDFPLYHAVRATFAGGKPIEELAKVLAQDRLYTRPEYLVTFLGLHDVARFMHEPGADLAGLKLAWTFLMTTRGIPMIYYGDEIAMLGGNDPDNRRDFPAKAFDASGRSTEQQEVFAHLQRLAQIRAKLEPLRRASIRTLAVEKDYYAFAREQVIVLINNATTPKTVTCPVALTAIQDGQLLTDQLSDSQIKVSDGAIQVTLPARSARIYTEPRP